MLLPEINLSSGTFIQIGAGAALAVEGRLRAPGAPGRVVLVEPHPTLAKVLATRFAGSSQVTVAAVALGSPDGPAEGLLHVFSNLAHSSLYAPLAALRALLPGLRQIGTVPVPIVSASQLLDSLGDLPHPLHIEIDAPGAERDILVSLMRAGYLDQVAYVDLRAGAEPLYDAALGADGLRQMLEQAGFQMQLTLADDPDWPELRFLANPARPAPKGRLAGQTAASGGRDRTGDQPETARAAVEPQEAAARIAALEAALAEAKAALAETGAEAKAVTDRCAALDRTATQLRGQIDQLTADAQRGALDLQLARQDLGLSVRLQDRLHNDLRDLQDRFEQLQAVRRDQDDLLRQLTPRLQDAARQLQVLAVAEDPPDSSGARLKLPGKAAKKTKKTRKPKV